MGGIRSRSPSRKGTEGFTPSVHNTRDLQQVRVDGVTVRMCVGDTGQ